MAIFCRCSYPLALSDDDNGDQLLSNLEDGDEIVLTLT